MPVTHFIRYFVLPPGCLVLLGAAGLILCWRGYRRPGLVLGGVAVTLLYLLSIPLVSLPLAKSIEAAPAISAARARSCGAQAIVVLGGGHLDDAREYGGPSVSESSLFRARYGAWLQHRTGLPVLLSGGGGPSGNTEASTMKEVMQEFGVDKVWTESHSLNTWQNALYSRPILRSHGVHRILLVTRAQHMGRAAACFRAMGFEVVPAPTGLATAGRWDLGVFAVLPQWRSLARSCDSLEGWLGVIWYRLYYFR